MSSEEIFLQQFASRFLHYCSSLTLETKSHDDGSKQLQRLNEAAEGDRMMAAARLALLEIEANVRKKQI